MEPGAVRKGSAGLLTPHGLVQVLLFRGRHVCGRHVSRLLRPRTSAFSVMQVSVIGVRAAAHRANPACQHVAMPTGSTPGAANPEGL
jgi:hypothetical protein